MEKQAVYGKMDKLRFGTPGIPLSTPKPVNTLNGIKQTKKLGLDAFEIEFTRGTNISKEVAPEIKEIAKKNDIILTCHGSYYINLNANDPAKLGKTKGIIHSQAARIYECGGWSITFHFGFYMKQDSEKVYTSIKSNLKEILKKLNDEGVKIIIRPELTGKETQWGNLKEIIKLSQEVENVLPCIDFAHYHARYNGKYNSYGDFSNLLAELEKGLGKTIINNMHIQASGIEFTDKGERSHIPFAESSFNYKEMLRALKDFKAKGVIVSESPLIEKDALLLQKEYRKL